MTPDENNLGWIDMEMTGLDPKTCAVLEIATLVTDKDLNILAEGPVLAVHQPSEVLAGMDDWCKVHHGKSGLTDRVKTSSLSAADAEQRTLAFLSQWIPPGKSPLCGNSVHQDRRFLYEYLPGLEAFFHYRIIDVSTVKELVNRWYPDLPEFGKKKAHLALDDIKESVGELKYYREKIFRWSRTSKLNPEQFAHLLALYIIKFMFMYDRSKEIAHSIDNVSPSQVRLEEMMTFADASFAYLHEILEGIKLNDRNGYQALLHSDGEKIDNYIFRQHRNAVFHFPDDYDDYINRRVNFREFFQSNEKEISELILPKLINYMHEKTDPYPSIAAEIKKRLSD